MTIEQCYAEFSTQEAIRKRYQEIDAREVILDVKGVCKEFISAKKHVQALKDIHFQVHRREFVCVIGPSGCGKSTLIRILAGLEQATSGEVLLDGKPVSKPDSNRGMVFQGYSLFPWLTVQGNVMFGPRMQKLSRDDARRKADEWLEIVGLEKFAKSYPYELSGGMRQRVAIARALVNEPRILLMDEPFGALDAQTRAHMQYHLMEVWKKINVTVLFITHDLDEAVYLADRILVLKPHPGEVLKLIDVPVPRPREESQQTSEAFQATKQLIEELIYPQKNDVPAEEKVLRMVRVDDNVE